MSNLRHTNLQYIQVHVPIPPLAIFSESPPDPAHKFLPKLCITEEEFHQQLDVSTINLFDNL